MERQGIYTLVLNKLCDNQHPHSLSHLLQPPPTSPTIISYQTLHLDWKLCFTDYYCCYNAIIYYQLLNDWTLLRQLTGKILIPPFKHKFVSCLAIFSGQCQMAKCVLFAYFIEQITEKSLSFFRGINCASLQVLSMFVGYTIQVCRNQCLNLHWIHSTLDPCSACSVNMVCVCFDTPKIQKTGIFFHTSVGTTNVQITVQELFSNEASLSFFLF